MIVQWQFDNHKEFVYSFINTIAHGPLMHQHSDWRIVVNILKGSTIGGVASDRSSKLFKSRVLVVFGDSDSVVREREMTIDLREIFGSDDVETNIVSWRP